MEDNSAEKPAVHWAKHHKPQLLALSLWLLFILILVTIKSHYGMTFESMIIDSLYFLKDNGWGPIFYILFYTFRPITFFPGTGISILSGALFGFGLGTFLTIIAANASAIVSYLIGRFFGHKFNLQESKLRQWIKTVYDKPFLSILFMRLFFFPFDGTGFFAGAVKAKFTSYVSATFLGTLLGIMSFVSFGASIDMDMLMDEGITMKAFDWHYLLLSAVLFAIILLFSKLTKRFKPTQNKPL